MTAYVGRQRKRLPLMERHWLRRLKDKVDRPWHLMLLLSFSIHHLSLSLSGHTAYHLLLRKSKPAGGGAVDGGGDKRTDGRVVDRQREGIWL